MVTLGYLPRHFKTILGKVPRRLCVTYSLPTLAEIEEAARIVYRFMPPTPQYCWPGLSSRCDCEVWVKHENHTPVGAFKIRGGLVYMDNLVQTQQDVQGVVTATRGNHGQSITTAARQYGLTSTIIVPEGNSMEKNAAMRTQGAELIEYGHDFQAAREYAIDYAIKNNLHLISSLDPLLIHGVSTYAWEFFTAIPDLHTVYVPIGQGSGICGMIAARNALGLQTKIVGVVADTAPAYALSFDAKKPVSTTTAHTMADGVACRTPISEAVEIILKGAERIARVSENSITDAMHILFTDTHNVAEGAGAVGLAALFQDMDKIQGKKVGFILSGGNVDAGTFKSVLEGSRHA